MKASWKNALSERDFIDICKRFTLAIIQTDLDSRIQFMCFYKWYLLQLNSYSVKKYTLIEEISWVRNLFFTGSIYCSMPLQENKDRPDYSQDLINQQPVQKDTNAVLITQNKFERNPVFI